MSYDLELCDKEGNVICLDEPHNLRGGTYAIGDKELALNITYNYEPIFKRVIDGGIRSLYGKTGGECAPILMDAIGQLDDTPSDNYWDATEGNACIVLLNLFVMCSLAPEGVWHGD